MALDSQGDAPGGDLGFLRGAGAMRDRVLAHDWSATSLGTLETWPQSLRVAAGLVLVSRLPMFLAWGPDLSLLYNDEYALILRERDAIALGRPMREVWADLWDQVGPFVDQTLAGEAAGAEDLRTIVDRNGRTGDAWYTFSSSPLRDERGAVAGIYCVCTETSGKVLAERRLQLLVDLGDRLRPLNDPLAVTSAAAELLRAHLAAGRAGFAEVDPTAETISVLSDWTDGRLDSLAGRKRALSSLSDNVMPLLLEGGVLKVRDMAANPRTAPFAAAYEDMGVRALMVAPLLHQGRLRALLYAHSSEPRHWTDDEAKLAADVAERAWAAVEQARAEASLRESEARFRAMADSAAAPIWVTGASGGLEFANDALLAFAGVARGQMTGDAWMGLVHADDLPTLLKRRAEAWKTFAPYVFEARFRRDDGEWRWLRASCNPRRAGAGAFQGYVGIGMDMTEVRRAAERLEAEVVERTQELHAAEETLRQAQKMEAIGQLTGGIAHDFNNLLTGILGSLHLMRRRIDEGRTQDLERFMEAAAASANRAAALTHRLLAFARRQSLDPRPLDVNDLVASMEELLHRTLGEQIRLETALDPDLWPALADANQLESAVLNLSINARDAMPEGGKLTIHTGNLAVGENPPWEAQGLAPGDYVCLCVGDTGTGMAPEVIERAFDPFFTTKPIGQGTGLGLSMIYGFARQSGGQVRIASKVGEGTTVKLLLPRHTGPAHAEAAPSEDVAPRGAGETVLVVEDDASVRLLVVETLRDLGYGALQAPDASAALPILESGVRLDLLISDVGLPGMNGRQLADVARQHRPRLKVLFITGYAESATERGGFLEPEMELITKPFAMEALAAKISEMVSGAT